MNLSHIVHEFSFGPFFPAIAQPLDMTYEHTSDRGDLCLAELTSAFTIFQYFLRVVPTTYIDASLRQLATSQVRDTVICARLTSVRRDRLLALV